MVPRVAITVRLDPDVAYWINCQPMSQAKVIEMLVETQRTFDRSWKWEKTP